MLSEGSWPPGQARGDELAEEISSPPPYNQPIRRNRQYRPPQIIRITPQTAK